MSFLGNLVKAPLKGIGDIFKGVGQTLISPFKAAWDALKTVGNVALDFITFKWGKIPGDVVKGTTNIVKDIGVGPLNILRGSVGLGAMAVGTVGGTMIGGPWGGAAGYAASAQFANWI